MHSPCPAATTHTAEPSDWHYLFGDTLALEQLGAGKAVCREGRRGVHETLPACPAQTAATASIGIALRSRVIIRDPPNGNHCLAWPCAMW